MSQRNATRVSYLRCRFFALWLPFIALSLSTTDMADSARSEGQQTLWKNTKRLGHPGEKSLGTRGPRKTPRNSKCAFRLGHVKLRSKKLCAQEKHKNVWRIARLLYSEFPVRSNCRRRQPLGRVRDSRDTLVRWKRLCFRCEKDSIRWSFEKVDTWNMRNCERKTLIFVMKCQYNDRYFVWVNVY